MKKSEIIQALRNPLAQTPENPAGVVDLDDAQITAIHGGTFNSWECVTTLLYSCCNSGTCP